MLDPVWLRSFLAVAETGGFTEAARRLCLGQSTVSQHVRRLEQATGRQLFVRDTHSVKLTGDGEALTGFAHNILEQERLAMAYFARPELRGKVRLGVCEDLVLGHLPATLRRFRATHPLVDLELTVELSSLLHDRLAAGGLDLVLAKRRTEADGHLLWREPLVWVGRPGLRLTKGEPVPLVVYPEPSLTRARALEALRACGMQWRIGCWSDRLNGLRAAALAGLGVAVFARSVVPEGLVPVEGELPPLAEVDFAVLGGRRAGHGPAAALAELIIAARWP
ncbi:LysR substrate-binding domain-containing protein [Crossiella sp. CA-258035]|uniref:LysR family transcriptional regulator n=1 Tax=Crossiella sp. CA-258035 TaxID=2981138 RepID=UPI0024BCB18B|nr:LysR substrate-binding domain-containing protein [Crossiella sp. CA-258035]WHT17458.1 LysR substrate-binding domain-containing protein [Crossiella sp. CA-258035]